MPSPATGIFRRKPVEDIERVEGGGLARTLGLWQLMTTIGIGGIIGAGIFSLAGAVANETAGPAVVISFLVAGVASAAAAFSYAEYTAIVAVVPIVGVVFSLWLITFLKPETWLRFGIRFAIGLVLYFAYGRRKSALAPNKR